MLKVGASIARRRALRDAVLSKWVLGGEIFMALVADLAIGHLCIPQRYLRTHIDECRQR